MKQASLNYRLQLILKRSLDILLSFTALFFIWPVILVIVALIRLDSPGPAIYRHKRIGKDGKPFDLFKFRSMVIGSDDSKYMRYLQELIESAKEGDGKPYRKMDNDPRVTRVGKILRQYYIDELPQLWNILKGEMSLVGPRPHVQYEVDHYTPDQLRRLAVRPGATGLWQVEGKADCSFNELLDIDLRYIDGWNFWLDIRIIWKTAMIILHGGEGSGKKLNNAPTRQEESPFISPVHDTEH